MCPNNKVSDTQSQAAPQASHYRPGEDRRDPSTVKGRSEALGEPPGRVGVSVSTGVDGVGREQVRGRRRRRSKVHSRELQCTPCGSTRSCRRDKVPVDPSMEERDFEIREWYLTMRQRPGPYPYSYKNSLILTDGVDHI